MCNIDIKQVLEDKKKYLDLLLLADEQENMIDRYLERGEMFVLESEDVKAVCVVTDEGDGEFEIKNIAVEPGSQRLGYGRRMLEHILFLYKDRGTAMYVGTGDSPLTIPFYESAGFKKSYQIDNFFTEHYDAPIFESGRQLEHMIVLKKKLT
ncbi:GNAT family N-acetyltransferase [Salinicoccus halodurans]|uniref:Acetyltransferase (GNAT) domain-containing protein n=1 Tax=Salinicoccus halodurans TaxID=407035 RepID=A0A0F7HIN0_9STAP|nr:GNAT family N-acetyltransferase [Salinicoccus halodurans]AKG73122.1 GNAT family acetyltransferase [Salinicoccus halodurans]SFK85206.1 Acetyltransferase (GNAT) domain-containing protein [Salinicoccus halodurans]